MNQPPDHSDRHGLHVPHRGHVIGVFPETSRRVWLISDIEENGIRVVELRLCRRNPNGGLMPSRHRSTVRPDAFRAMAKTYIEAETSTESSAVG